MENDRIIIEGNKGPADTSPTILFIFSLVTMLLYLMERGILSQDAQLLLACIQIGGFPVYLNCAKYSIQKNENLFGNCYMIFAALFGLAGGLSNLALYFAGVFGWPADQRIMGILWIWSGIMLIPVVAGMIKGPCFPLFVFTLTIPMLILLGISTFGYFTASLSPIISTLELIISLWGFYCCIANLFIMAGFPLPLGKPIIH